ncbi:MAG: nucleotidyltransferase domain-containing protein [Roseiflexaceae bacterium]
MSNLALTTTRIPAIDAILLGIVHAFEHALPNRVRAYYLLGSYVEGTAVPLSDIDCFVIFADQFATPQEQAFALVPAAEPERLELRELCQQMLGFENEFLRLCDMPDKR